MIGRFDLKELRAPQRPESRAGASLGPGPDSPHKSKDPPRRQASAHRGNAAAEDRVQCGSAPKKRSAGDGCNGP